MTLPDNPNQTNMPDLSDNPRILKRGDVIRGVIVGEKHGGILFDIGWGNTAKLSWGTYVPVDLEIGDVIVLSVVEPTSATGDAVVEIKERPARRQKSKSEEARYTMAEAADKLGVSNKTLVNWINNMGWRDIVDKQVFEHDRRSHYLFHSQLVQMAQYYRRTVRMPSPPAESDFEDPILWQLKRKIEWLQKQVDLLMAAFGDKVSEDQIRSVILGDKDKSLSQFDKEEVNSLIRLAMRNRDNIISGPETPPE